MNRAPHVERGRSRRGVGPSSGCRRRHVDDATDDRSERDMLWRRLCSGVFIAAIAEADQAGQVSMAERLNDGLAKEGVGWRIVKDDG
jgi:hypothetical protein